ncbi:MAG: M48 family metallopeptidase [Bacteroidota bacterium]
MVLGIILTILLLNFGLDRILSWLNLRHQQPQLPDELAGDLDASQYAKAYQYHQVNHRFDLFRSSISMGVMLCLLVSGAFGWLDEQLRTITEDPIWLPLLFFGVLFVVSDIMTIPFQWYRTFTIETRFGFNKTTPRTFWMDKIKGYVLTILIGGIVLTTLLALIQSLGPNFWLWFWLFISVFMFGVNLFYTSLLLPIFNKLTPLEGGPLRNAIEDYSEEVSFPLDNIFVMDGSRRSSKANAFFSGLGRRKKVVLFDTLIEKHGEAELVAVLAHEVGHYKKRHIQQGLALGIMQTGLMLFLLSLLLFMPELSAALGSGSGEAVIHLNLIAFGLLYSPISLVISLLMNVFSRKNEFEADAFAANTYQAGPLKQALVKLHGDSLSNLTPHPWYVFFHYSHPPLLQRLAALGKSETL